MNSSNGPEQISMFSSEEHLANHSALQDSEMGWLIQEAISHSSILALLTYIGPAGWFGRTSPALCQQMMETILPPSLEGWSNSGMASHGECLTLNTCEHAAFRAPSLNDDRVCSLLDILETGDVPARYFLTPKACAGILRRAERRGKTLSPHLMQALTLVAGALISSPAEE